MTGATSSAECNHVNDYSGNTPFDIEYRLRRKDGSYRWFKAIGATVREGDGTPIVVAGSILDITDSKKNKEIESEMKVSVINLAQALSEMTKTVDQATKDMTSVAEKQAEIVKSTDMINESVEASLKIIDSIQDIASRGAAMEEINANIEELSAMSETISQISQGMTE